MCSAVSEINRSAHDKSFPLSVNICTSCKWHVVRWKLVSPDVVVLRSAQWSNACVCTGLCNKSWNTMWLPLTATKKIHYYINEAPLSLRTRIRRFLAEIKSSVAHSLKKCRYSAGDITVRRSLKSCRCDIPWQVECSHATAGHISLRSQLDPLLTAMCCVEYEVINAR